MKFLFPLLIVPFAILAVNFVSLAPGVAVQAYGQARSSTIILEQFVDPDVIFRGLINH